MNTVDNDDWIVDDLGMHAETRDGQFEIAAESLAEMTSIRQGDCLHWPVFIASETRFEIDAFLRAFRFALVRHGGRYAPGVDEALLSRSEEIARDIWGGRAICG